MLDVMHGCRRLVVIPTPVCYHRISRTSLMNNELKPQRFEFVPWALKYLCENCRGCYPEYFWNWFYSGFLHNVWIDAFLLPMKSKKYRTAAADMLRRVWGTELMPARHYRPVQKFMLSLFIKAWGTSE
jgi:hypothetical protein